MGYIIDNQNYELQSKDENSIWTLYHVTAIKSTLQNLYNQTNSDNSKDEDGNVREGIVSLMREFGKDSFEEAWDELMKRINAYNDSMINEKTISPVYLVIEEINRGNCAQIFGDIFQLLDRQDNGFSTYPIEADTDLQEAIKKAFEEEDEFKIDGEINVEGAVEGYKSIHGGYTLSEDIREGNVLLLPPNLFIWATMNTSDQSLFPIDSAFKRRWEWKYVKIADAGKGWQIEGLGDESWYQFIEQINKVIEKMTSSADKQLGYFFCKPDKKSDPSKPKNDVISLKTFVGKVVFYLWNDVFKDYGFENKSLFEMEGKTKITFPDFYGKTGDDINKDVVNAFLCNVMCWEKSEEDKKKIRDKFFPKADHPAEQLATEQQDENAAG